MLRARWPFSARPSRHLTFFQIIARVKIVILNFLFFIGNTISQAVKLYLEHNLHLKI